jgi:hypothetical protein
MSSCLWTVGEFGVFTTIYFQDMMFIIVVIINSKYAFVRPDEQCQTCLDIAMAKKG